MINKKITKKYKTVAQLIAHNYSEIIGIEGVDDKYYLHLRNSIYDFINPMSTYKEAKMINGALCIKL